MLFEELARTKVHKEGVPLRPILAAFSAPSCKLARFLINLMSNLTRNEYTINNTYDFKDQLDSLEYSHEIFSTCSYILKFQSLLL